METTLISAAVAATIAVISMPAAAAPPQARPPRMHGLASGQGVTLTTSPNGEAISLLYDHLKLELLPSDPKPTSEKAIGTRFTIAVARPGRARLS